MAPNHPAGLHVLPTDAAAVAYGGQNMLAPWPRGSYPPLSLSLSLSLRFYSVVVSCFIMEGRLELRYVSEQQRGALLL